VSCLKNNIKIYIKTAATCFDAVPSSVSALFVLTLVSTNNALTDNGTASKHVAAVLM